MSASQLLPFPIIDSMSDRPASAQIPIRLAHSPDPDDAFMWWPLVGDDGRGPEIDTGRWAFETVAEDIETLNRRAESGDFEITAMSCAQYGRTADRYALTACGASVGDGYGPKLVAREGRTIESLTMSPGASGSKQEGSGVRIAVPGERTTAFLVTSLLLGPGRFLFESVPFERIIDEVVAGRFDAGVVIHEGQLTFGDSGLCLVTDLGVWWKQRTGMPLPLGVNAIRRSLNDDHGPDAMREITSILRRSVECAMAQRDRSVAYALRYARGLDAERAGRFVDLYVNRWTLDFGDEGRAAVRHLLGEAHAAGLLPTIVEPEFISP